MTRSLLTARRGWPIAWLASLAALACGCRHEGEPLLPVAGRVTLKGKPVTEGSISFRPDANKANASLHHPTGHINADGSYRLYVREREGAPPGWYKVLVFVNEPIVDQQGKSHPGMPKSIIDRKYNRPEATPLAVEVTASAAPGAYDFDLRPAR